MNEVFCGCWVAMLVNQSKGAEAVRASVLQEESPQHVNPFDASSYFMRVWFLKVGEFEIKTSPTSWISFQTKQACFTLTIFIPGRTPFHQPPAQQIFPSIWLRSTFVRAFGRAHVQVLSVAYQCLHHTYTYTYTISTFRNIPFKGTATDICTQHVASFSSPKRFL